MIGEAGSPGRKEGAPNKIAGSAPRASFAQERIWFLEQVEPGEATYNQLNGIRIKGELDHAALEKSLRDIISRHSVLFSSLKMVNGELLQAASDHEFGLLVTDLTPLPRAARLLEAEAQAVKGAKEPFILSEGPMIRACLFRLEHA